MNLNEQNGSASDEVAAAEAELRAAQETLKAARARLSELKGEHPAVKPGAAPSDAAGDGEPAEAFGTGQAMMLNAFVKPAFFAAGGRLMPECTLKSVGDGEIVVANSFGMDVALACDCVVDASTMSPNTALADELSGEFDVHVIGDAAEPLSIQNAITTGNLTARNC